MFGRGGVCVQSQGEIVLQGRCYLNSYPNGSPFRVALITYNKQAKILIGDNCKLNGCQLHANNLIRFGNECRIGPGTIFCDNDSHYVSNSVEERSTREPANAPIILRDNVWVGMNCIILKGVEIGENTIIAAGSVVTKSCEANAIYGGNPANKIKEL